MGGRAIGGENGVSWTRSKGDGRADFESGELEVDHLYDVLSNRRRRFAIHYLKQSSGPTTVGELSETVAAWEEGCDPADVGPDQRKRVYTALQQSHLPVMERAGIVEYDKDRKRVEATTALSEVDVYVSEGDDPMFTWRRVTIGLSALFGVVVAGLWLGVEPIASVSPLAWANVFLAAILVSTIGGEYADRRREASQSEAPPELTG